MPTSRHDRSEILALHGLSISISSVSNKPPAEWRRPATAISPAHSNPFSQVGGGSGTANVGKSKMAGGNGQQARVVNRMRKPQMKAAPNRDEEKFTSNLQKSRTVALVDHRPSKRQRIAEAGPSRVASSGQTIDLSYEDDYISVGQSSSKEGTSQITRSSSRKSSPPSTKPRPLILAKDGPDMQELDKQAALAPDDDPIESFSTPPRELEHLAGSSTVRDHVKKFEQLSAVQDRPPREDLRARVKMKPRSRSFGPAALPPPSSRDAKDKGKKRKWTGSSLPLLKCYVEPNIIGSESRFRWDEYALFVPRWAEVEREISVEKKNFDQVIYTPPDSNAPAFLRLSLSRDKDKGPSLLILSFNCQHSDWDLGLYTSLIDWLKANCSTSARTSASSIDSFWADVEQDRKIRGKTSTKTNGRGFETLSDDGTGIHTKPQHASSGKPTFLKPATYKRTLPQRHLLGNLNLKNTSHSSEQVSKGPSSKAIPNTASSSTDATKELVSPLRRSTRQSAGGAAQPPADSDEVILVYPQGVAGKVNITNSDIARLQPGEFLNDTLIEFGLKLWLRELEEKSPELAKQVHVFSSFFYKKLNKRNTEEGYSSVRKWTAKFDLFEKKYIIVPINEHMHWYLALIYEPEHVVSSPFPPNPTPPPPKTEQDEPPAEHVEVMRDISLDMDDIEIEGLQHKTSSEQGVEEHLTTLTQACSISAIEDARTVPHDREEDIIVMNVDSDAVTGSSPHREQPIMIDSDTVDHARLSPMRFTPEIPETPSRFKGKSVASTASSTTGDDADDLNIVVGGDLPPIDIEEDAGISPESFYGTGRGTRSGRKYGKDAPSKPTPKPRRSLAEVHIPDRTYVLTLDSLGSRHLQAARQLAKYLKFEAKDKKGIDSEATIELKQVHVPTQPNFADCGLYLLHLAQTFISDPKFYMDKAFTTSNSTSLEKRQEYWHDAKARGMREDMKARIYELSKEWKLLQTQKPTSKGPDQATIAADAASSSDSDIDIIEPTVASSTKGKGRASHKTPAARIR